MSGFHCKALSAFFSFLFCAGICILLAGCSSFSGSSSNGIRPTDDEKVVATVKHLLGKEAPEVESNVAIEFHGLRHGVSLRDYADTIAMKFYEQFIPSAGVTVTSFVNYDASLNTTHAFGNQLSEALKTSLTKVGYPIVEANLAEQIEITDKGNFVLTRKSQNRHFEFVVIGTVIHRKHGLDIDARLIEAKTQKTYAASSLTIPAFMFE